MMSYNMKRKILMLAFALGVGMVGMTDGAKADSDWHRGGWDHDRRGGWNQGGWDHDRRGDGDRIGWDHDGRRDWGYRDDDWHSRQGWANYPYGYGPPIVYAPQPYLPRAEIIVSPW